jgi:hypothetical protein
VPIAGRFHEAGPDGIEVRISQEVIEMRIVQSVIRHQAIAEYPDSHLRGAITEQIEIQPVIASAEKNLLAIISSLRDMMRHAGKDKGLRGTWPRSA